MPTNLYGPGDNFDLVTSHVVPALIAKMHAARLAGQDDVVVWGTGTPRREFLYVEDCADALVHLMQHYSGAAHVNVGTGEDMTIRKAAETIAEVTGFTGRLAFDASKPDGTPRKRLDIGKLTALNWAPRTSFAAGVRKTYRWYLHQSNVRAA